MIFIASSIRSRCVRWLTMHARIQKWPFNRVLDKKTRFEALILSSSLWLNASTSPVVGL